MLYIPLSYLITAHGHNCKFQQMFHPQRGLAVLADFCPRLHESESSTSQKNLPHVTGSKGFLPLSKEVITFPCHEPDQSRPPPNHHQHHQPTSLWFILMISSIVRLYLPSGLFFSKSPIKTLYSPPLAPIHATCPAHLIFFFDHPDSIWGGIQVTKLLTVQFSSVLYYFVTFRRKISSSAP